MLFGFGEKLFPVATTVCASICSFAFFPSFSFHSFVIPFYQNENLLCSATELYCFLSFYYMQTKTFVSSKLQTHWKKKKKKEEWFKIIVHRKIEEIWFYFNGKTKKKSKLETSDLIFEAKMVREHHSGSESIEIIDVIKLWLESNWI